MKKIQKIDQMVQKKTKYQTIKQHGHAHKYKKIRPIEAEIKRSIPKDTTNKSKKQQRKQTEINNGKKFCSATSERRTCTPKIAKC